MVSHMAWTWASFGTQRTAKLRKPWSSCRGSPHRDLEPVTSEEAPTSMKREPDAKFELNGPSGMTTTGPCHLRETSQRMHSAHCPLACYAYDKLSFCRLHASFPMALFHSCLA